MSFIDSYIDKKIEQNPKLEKEFVQADLDLKKNTTNESTIVESLKAFRDYLNGDDSHVEVVNVKAHTDDCLTSESYKLTKPEGISDKTLKVMDESIANLKKGKMSTPVDLSDLPK